MKKLIISLAVSILVLNSCKTEHKTSPLEVKIDSLENKLYLVMDTLQELRKQLPDTDPETPAIADIPNGGFDNDRTIYESGLDDEYIEGVDKLHGSGERFVFAVITYRYANEANGEVITYSCGVQSRQSFSRDEQAKVMDWCANHLELGEAREIKIVSRKAYMAYTYSAASEKLAQIKRNVH